MIDPSIPKPVSCRSKQEKKGNCNFYASNTARKCQHSKMGVKEAVEVGMCEILELVGGALRLWRDNENEC